MATSEPQQTATDADASTVDWLQHGPHATERSSLGQVNYIFQMYRLSKVYPPDKTVLNDITLAFLPGAKIGVLG